MNLTTSTDGQILGKAQCPGDKSISQRALMIGAFMNQDMVIDGFLHGEDPLSTMNAFNQIGAGISLMRIIGFIYVKEIKVFIIAKMHLILVILALACVSCLV